MVDATHLLHTSVFNTMPDPAAPSQCVPSLQDPVALNDGSGRVCKDPPIWIFDGLLSEKLLQQVDAKLDVLPWHSMNGRCVRMAELAVDGALEELPQKLRSVCHIEDVAEYGRIWVMDVIGRDQGPHIDGWELEQAKQQMHDVDLSRCSVQEHKGFSTVIPTLSFVVYFNDVGGIAFPEAELSTPVIRAKRGRIVMFQNYDDSKRPAHNPKAVHYGVYAGSGDDVPFKRVLTAGVMASETPPQLLGNQKAAPSIPGFLYAPIMHRSNTSCGSIDSDYYSPPAPPPKERPLLQLQARGADDGKIVVEAVSLAGEPKAKLLAEPSITVGQLTKELSLEARLIVKGHLLEKQPNDKPMAELGLLEGVALSTPASATGEDGEEGEKEEGAYPAWDVIDTVFAKDAAPKKAPKGPRK